MLDERPITGDFISQTNRHFIPSADTDRVVDEPTYQQSQSPTDTSTWPNRHTNKHISAYAQTHPKNISNGQPNGQTMASGVWRDHHWVFMATRKFCSVPVRPIQLISLASLEFIETAFDDDGLCLGCRLCPSRCLRMSLSARVC